MSTGAQQPVADTDHAAVEIDTYGRIARSFIELCDTVAGDEGVRLHVSDGELRAAWVDQANVCMGSARLDLDDSLDSIAGVDGDGEEFIAGIQPRVLADRLAFARKTVGGELGDPLTLRIEDGPAEDMLRGRTEVTIRRRDGPATLTRESAVRNVDPDSLRSQPEPDIELLWSAHIQPETFATIVNAIDDTDANHVRLRPGELTDDRGRALVCEASSETASDEFRVTGVVGRRAGTGTNENDDETAGSLLSPDYLTEIADALTSAKMDTLTIGFRDQYPIRLRYSRAEWGLSGEFWVAPRVESDDELGGGQP